MFFWVFFCLFVFLRSKEKGDRTLSILPQVHTSQGYCTAITTTTHTHTHTSVGTRYCFRMRATDTCLSMFEILKMISRGFQNILRHPEIIEDLRRSGSEGEIQKASLGQAKATTCMHKRWGWGQTWSGQVTEPLVPAKAMFGYSPGMGSLGMSLLGHRTHQYVPEPVLGAGWADLGCSTHSQHESQCWERD